MFKIEPTRAHAPEICLLKPHNSHSQKQLSLLYMQHDEQYSEARSLIGPVLFVMILAYFIADMFMVVFSMAMDTMMHCYLSDKESNVPEVAVVSTT